MAQRAIININGDLIPFSEDLDRIRTPGLGGSAVTWVPDADTKCDQLKVTANGTYSAAEAGKYGYDYVVVSVPGSSVTGRDPDTGEEVEVHPDPETGEIVTTVLPTEIRVITPPNKTDYADGETIDYSGIVVHAYSSTGQDMGAVPFGELVFPITTAHADGDAWTDGQGLNAIMLSYTPHYYVDENGDDQTSYCSQVIGVYNGNPAAYGYRDEPGVALFTRYNGNNYGKSISGSRYANLIANMPDKNVDGKYYGWMSVVGSSLQMPINAFGIISFENYITDIPISTVNPTTVDPTNLHATQSLPVQWPRTPDGAVLETTFSINVTGGST